MLSIGKIAVGQHRYYEQQVAQGRDDYYAGRGEAPGEWVGAGADALGLAGRVSAHGFGALIAGRDPRDPGLALRCSAKAPSVAALDLTFSAPKSVSVLAAVGSDGLARELILAHEQALRAALVYLEETAVRVRRGHDGRRVQEGEGLIAAAYRHRMSRSLDPQLHTHVVAANMTRGPDGRYTALHAAPLYRVAKTAGYLYQAHLRALVSERLGLEWGPVRKGAGELIAVPEGVLVEFSKRRHEMQRVALAGGIALQTKAGGQAAALATRERKRYGIDTHTWREEVRARAGELGLGSRELQELLREGRTRAARGASRAGLDERRFGDHLAGAQGLTERANTFDEHAVLQAFAQAAGSGGRVGELRARAARFAGRIDVLQAERGEMTTADLVECERRLVAAALSRAGEHTGVLYPRLAEGPAPSGGVALTGEQTAAVHAVVSSGAGVSVIEAIAGTGKTLIAGVLRDLYERAGYAVLGVAPTARAARELAEQAGVAARTLDRMLLDLEELGDELPERCVVILDEAGMAPTRLTARLLEAAQTAGAKVVVIGDPGQLSSVNAGGWLAALAVRLDSVHLREVMRQRDAAERRALAALHEHRPRRYLRWAERAGRIETFEDVARARERAVEEWGRAADRHGLAEAVMIARDNETRAALNTAARELCKARGRLAQERRYGVLALAVGDRVICRRNERTIDVDNGMRGTIRHLDSSCALVRTDSGRVRELPAAYVAEHVEHAYALTGHGMQGATVESAVVLASPRDLTAGWSYTALSRAREHTRLLIHDEKASPGRSEYAPTTRLLRAGRPELLARVGKRMLDRDDEDLAIEQLPSPGRPGDAKLHAARSTAGGPSQEQAALRAEALDSHPGGRAPVRELCAQREELESQLAKLPTRELDRLDELDRRLADLARQCDDALSRLHELPKPRKRLRDHGGHDLERAHLDSVITALERQHEALLKERDRIVRELGDPGEKRAERAALEQTLAEVKREQADLFEELVERELATSPAWVKRAFGQCPSTPRLQTMWEDGVRAAARYRLQYEIPDAGKPLGHAPDKHHQQHDWQRDQQTVERLLRTLVRERNPSLDVEHGP